MNYMNEFLARLQSGENVEDIAAQLTKDINAANDAYCAEQAQKAQSQEKLRADKVAAMGDLLNAVGRLLAAYEVDTEVLNGLDPAELVNSIDEALPAIQEYVEFVAAMNELREKRAAAPKVQPEATPTDSIEDFLNKFVR